MKCAEVVLKRLLNLSSSLRSNPIVEEIPILLSFEQSAKGVEDVLVEGPILLCVCTLQMS